MVSEACKTFRTRWDDIGTKIIDIADCQKKRSAIIEDIFKIFADENQKGSLEISTHLRIAHNSLLQSLWHWLCYQF